MRSFLVTSLLLVCVAGPRWVLAEEGDAPPAETSSAPSNAASNSAVAGASSAPSATTSEAGADAAPAKSRSSSKSKGKRPREKEIEGTEARDRFQADTVLKSKYQYNGEQLEVDPD